MASEYKYDEGSETWPYFVLALLVFVLLPLTVTWVHRVLYSDNALARKKKVAGTISEDHNSLDVPNAHHINKFQSRRKSDRIFNKTLLFLILGWAIVAYIWLTYAKEVSLQGLFDPHTILDLPYSATEKDVKTKYKKLSLKFHPDKIPRGITEKAREEMEAAFIRINLAYKALTDEVTKNNIKMYGHPDGQQEISHGIAIPKFLVEGKYSPLMIVVYFFLIGVLLPVIVGNWWNNVKSHTKKGLHVDTASSFVRKLADKNPGKVFTPLDILDWILESEEIVQLHGLLEPEQIRALVLEYLNRDFTGTLEAEKMKIIAQLPELIAHFIDISTVFRNPDVILAAYELQKAIVQASSPLGKHKELLQLPFVKKEVVEAQSVRKLGKLLTLSNEEASKALGISDPKQLQDALSVAEKIPWIRVVDATFRVPGEDIVPPNSSSHLVLNFLIKSAKFKSCPEIDESRFLEEETMEDLKNPLKSNDDQPQLPLAYSPYFPNKIANHWGGFIIGQRDNKLVEGAEIVQLENVDLSNLSLTQEQWKEGKEDTVVLSTFKIKLTVPTPPAVGTYYFRLILKNNAYFGNDVDIPLEMVVVSPPIDVAAVKKVTEEDASDAENEDSDSDISDPEEDSLAGALAALRGGNVKKSKVHDDEDESDNESVFTDINTDTEDDAEN